MNVARVSTKLPLSKQTAAQLSKAVTSFSHSYGISSTPGLHLHIKPLQSRRQFSSTSRTRLRDYFPEPEKGQIFKTEAAWPHPG
jgi:hypothetical protein